MIGKLFVRTKWQVFIVYILVISQPIWATETPLQTKPTLCSRILGTAHYVDLKIKKIKE